MREGQKAPQEVGAARIDGQVKQRCLPVRKRAVANARARCVAVSSSGSRIDLLSGQAGMAASAVQLVRFPLRERWR